MTTTPTPPSPPTTSRKSIAYAIIPLGAAMLSMVIFNVNPLTMINSIGWLVASLIAAAGIFLGGEWLLKKLALSSFAVWGVRIPLIVTSLILIGLGVSQLSIGMQGISIPGWVTSTYNVVTTADTGVIVITTAIVLVAGIILYGAIKDVMSGNGVIAVKMWRTAAAILVGFALLFWLIGTSRMGQVGGAMQGAARTQLDAFLAGQPVNFAVDWGYVALGFFFLAFLWGLWKKEIIRTATAVVGAIIWLPFIVWLAWGSLPAEFKADVGGALGAANEAVNPFLGETQVVVIDRNDVGRDIPASIGPYDTLQIRGSVPGHKPCIDPSGVWKANHGHQPWFDPNAWGSVSGHYARQTVTLSPTLKEGMLGSGVPAINVLVQIVPNHASCPNN